MNRHERWFAIVAFLLSLLYTVLAAVIYCHSDILTTAPLLSIPTHHNNHTHGAAHHHPEASNPFNPEETYVALDERPPAAQFLDGAAPDDHHSYIYDDLDERSLFSFGTLGGGDAPGGGNGAGRSLLGDSLQLSGILSVPSFLFRKAPETAHDPAHPNHYPSAALSPGLPRGGRDPLHLVVPPPFDTAEGAAPTADRPSGVVSPAPSAMLTLEERLAIGMSA